MMKIQINEQWIIHFDGIQWMPKKVGVDGKGERTESAEAYCHTLAYAVEKVLKFELGDKNEIISMQEFLNKYLELRNELLESITNRFNEYEKSV